MAGTRLAFARNKLYLERMYPAVPTPNIKLAGVDLLKCPISPSLSLYVCTVCVCFTLFCDVFKCRCSVCTLADLTRVHSASCVRSCFLICEPFIFRFCCSGPMCTLLVLQINEMVEGKGGALGCTHFDAFRFFTPEAK